MEPLALSLTSKGSPDSEGLCTWLGELESTACPAAVVEVMCVRSFASRASGHVLKPKGKRLHTSRFQRLRDPGAMAAALSCALYLLDPHA